MNVVVTGGGTAGHVFPALATATALRDLHGASIVFIGAEDGQEAHLVPDAGFRFVPVQVAAAQARLSTATVRAVALAVRGSSSCRPLVAGADVVVSIGGFASGPAALAARRTRTPLVLIEPNSVPGVVNRIAARWAAAVATTFEGTAARLPSVRVERTGNPIRREIATVRSHRDRLRTEACEAFGLERDRTTVFVFGGSQGAVHLDRVVADALPALASRGDLQLLVSAGPGNDGDLARAVDRGAALRVSVVPFIDRMDRAFALADVVVARAGASVAEITACGLPSVLVPYPYATENHQEANARELVAAGAARMVLDAALSSSTLVPAILDLVEDASDEGRDEPSRARVGAPGRGRAHRSALRRDRGGAFVTEGDALWSSPPGSIPTLPVPRMAGIGRAHLIGIGGAGMRNLARLLLARGVAVQGSDLKRSRPLEDLEGAGVAVTVGHAASNVLDPPRPDVVITSSAIASDNPELVAAARGRHPRVAAPAGGRRGRGGSSRDRDRRHPR